MRKDLDELSHDLGNWRHLLYAADTLLQLPKEKDVFFELTHLLISLEEHFSRNLDPIDDFEAYAVRRFCMALRSVLEEREEEIPKRKRIGH